MVWLLDRSWRMEREARRLVLGLWDRSIRSLLDPRLDLLGLFCIKSRRDPPPPRLDRLGLLDRSIRSLRDPRLDLLGLCCSKSRLDPRLDRLGLLDRSSSSCLDPRLDLDRLGDLLGLLLLSLLLLRRLPPVPESECFVFMNKKSRYCVSEYHCTLFFPQTAARFAQFFESVAIHLR